MTTPSNLQQGGDSSQPARSRVQFIQELKASRLEKVRLHRVRGREAAAPRSAPAPPSSQRPLAPGALRPPGAAPAQPWNSTDRSSPRGSSLDTEGLGRGKVSKERGVSCPRLVSAGVTAEKQASALLWMGRRAPVDKGGEIAPGKVIPPSTIQTDLGRSPAAIGHARVLAPSEDPLRPPGDQLLQVENVKPQNTKAFVRLASEKCRAIILALPDSGNLCRADIMSLATFKKLNRCAVSKMQLDPVDSSQDIRSVTGSSLKIDGRIRGGLTVLLQGSAGTLHLNPLVSSNFTGPHLNLSQNTMARLRIQLRPNSTNGGYLVTQLGKAPLVSKSGVYSLNYEESLFKRISIFRHKNGWLHQKLKPTNKQPNKRTLEVGQIAVSERRGLRALGMENRILQEPGESPMVLTSDGFLQVPQTGTPKDSPLLSHLIVIPSWHMKI